MYSINSIELCINLLTKMLIHMISSGDSILLKVLVPSVAAGAIIGKGGETISHIQKETGAVIKMSKANDYYPGKPHMNTYKGIQSLWIYSVHVY